MKNKSSFEISYNITALIVAILRQDISIPEQAFSYISGEKYTFTIDDIKDMVKFKEQGMTYREIAKIYGLKKDNVYGKIRRFRKKKGIVSK